MRSILIFIQSCGISDIKILIRRKYYFTQTDYVEDFMKDLDDFLSETTFTMYGYVAGTYFRKQS